MVQVKQSLYSLAVNPAMSKFIVAIVKGSPVEFMVDTGAAVSLIRKDVWDRLGGASTFGLSPWRGRHLVGVEGSTVPVCGVTTLDFHLADQAFLADLVVVDSLKVESILGLDFLEKHEGIIDLSKMVLRLEGASIQLQHHADSSSSSDMLANEVSVSLIETVKIPAHSEIQTMAYTSSTCKGVWLVEGSRPDIPIIVAGAVVTPSIGEPLGSIPVLMCNPLPTETVVHKGTRIARATRLQDESLLAPVTDARSQERMLPKVSESKSKLLWEMVQNCAADLSKEEMEMLYHVLMSYADVFAESNDELGRTDMVKHSVDTGSNPPVRQQFRRMPPFRREQTRKLIEDMLKREVVHPSSSPWASPVVIAPKKDGSLRFCVDYRKVNSITRKDAYPLPRIDDSLEALNGSKWFSTLDLISGYWQVEMDENDRQKTAFCTQDGLFEFKVMPFGLCNAPATFQRLMDLVLSGIQWKSCLVYIDDIVIVGKSFQQHLSNLELVLDRLRQAGLRLKTSKCHLFREEVTFLGHRISRQGISTDPAKVSAVQNWKTPNSVQDVRQFLGLVGYYRKYIPHFAAIARPLHQLTERGREFQWTQECIHAFDELKLRLLSAPILSFPDFEKPFILDTDACQYGIGAVLSQNHDGEERVVAYGSRTLSKAERKYCVTRKELLAVVTFTKHFRPYLLGRRFTLRTDHSSLQWIYNMKEPEGQLARWLEQLQEYDFAVIHRRGCNHGNADALSRIGPDEIEADISGGSSSKGVGVSAVQPQQILTGTEGVKSMRQLQLEDENVGIVLRAVSCGSMVGLGELEGKSRELNILVQQWDQLVEKKGILYRRYEDDQGREHLQVIAPAVIRQDILKQLHEGVLGGHLGEGKTLSRLKERFYWPGHAGDVGKWCRTCVKCATRKMPPRRGRAPLQGISAGYPMQIVAVDIVGPITPGEAKNPYILVASDYFTRWAEAYAIPNQEAITVATKLVDEFFCRFSIPQQLHSDQGRQFESDVMKEVCKLLQISKTRTTPYHPQSDGLVERLNRTLISMLATSAQDNPTQWELHLRKICMAYNTSIHPSTGFSPFFLMFGRQAKLPVDLVYGSTPTESQPQHEYARQLEKILQGAFQVARENMGTATERMKEVYNQRVHGKQYEPGDLVWLHTPVVPKGKPRKLHCPWTGPFRVVKRLSAVTYRILDLRRIAARRRKRMVVHFDRLKPCPSDIRLDFDDVEAKNPETEGPSSANQSRHRPEYPGTTLQFFDRDDFEIAEQEIVQQPVPEEEQLGLDDQGHDAQAEVATPQDEPLALEVRGHEEVQAEVANPQDEDQPPPRRYPQRIRHPPDRY